MTAIALLLQQTPDAPFVDRESVERILNAPLFTIGQTPVTIVTLGTVGVIIIATFILAALAARATRRAISIRGTVAEGTGAAVGRLVRYAVLLIGLTIVLQTLGLNLGALFAAGAFFAVAMGFAMQDVAQNFVSGLILLGERSIKPGDVLEVEGRIVRVTRMGIRSTIARSRDDEDLIIPNGELTQNIVKNYTFRDQIFRLRASVGVAYESDMRLVKRVLTEVAEQFPGRLEDREPRIFMTEFGDSSVNFEISVWLRDPWQLPRAKSDFNEAIWHALKANNITIPFPQRDVHLIPPPSQQGARPARPASSEDEASGRAR